MANKKLRVIYRSNSHAPLWLVADRSGAWQKMVWTSTLRRNSFEKRPSSRSRTAASI